MTAFLAVCLAATAVLGTVVVLTRDPARQALVFGVYGWVLALLFFALHAPDVAMSQLVVGGLVSPALLLVTLGRLGRRR